MANEETEVFRTNAPQERALAEQSVPKTRQPAAEGDHQTRQLHDKFAVGIAGKQALADVTIGQHAPEALADNPISNDKADGDTDPLAAEAAADTPAKLVIPAIKKEEEAVPWAIAINLEQRIERLSSATAAANLELDALEASSKKLAKRIAS